MVPDSEFGYELLTCRWAELSWPPDEPGRKPVVVSRQLGTQQRRWDTVVLEVDADALAQRQRFGDRDIDSDLLHVVRNAPAEWEWYQDALPYPGYPWRYVRAAVHRAGGRGLIDKRKRDGRIELRQQRPYPDWVERVVAIENKPDLTASAADALAEQLEHDVETGLADEVWLATSATDDRVEPALLREMPVEAGILVTDFSEGVHADAADVQWLPSDLSRNERTDDQRTQRFELAERAYGKGWRSYHDTMRPDCRSFQLDRAGDALVPYCTAKGKCPTARECSGSCSRYGPEPPQWRTNGWPIEGGPGKGIQRLLDRRRERARERTKARDETEAERTDRGDESRAGD